MTRYFISKCIRIKNTSVNQSSSLFLYEADLDLGVGCRKEKSLNTREHV